MDAPAAQAVSPTVQSPAQRDHLMALNIRSFVVVAALCLPVTAAMAQAQPPSQQPDDPASVGTGPSSRSPGEMNYEMIRATHAVLGLLPTVEPTVVRAAYRALAQAHHPDHGGAEARIVAINAAFATLTAKEQVS